MVKNVLICIDRDGTIIYDDKYHLGRQKEWKSMIKFLKNAIPGLKLLNKIPNSALYIITNQPGVGIKEFPLLTMKKAKEVDDYLIKMLRKEGIKINGAFFCPYSTKDYTISHSEYTFEKKYVKNSIDLKPRPGMVFQALKKSGFKRSNTQIFVIGDRGSDVQCGLNARGYGILTPFINHPTELSKVKKLKNKKIYIAKDFLDAVKFIESKVK